MSLMSQPPLHPQGVAQPDQSVPDPCLGGADRDVEHAWPPPCGCSRRSRPARRPGAATRSGPTGACGPGWLRARRWPPRRWSRGRPVALLWCTSCRGGVDASAERTRSTALRWTMVSSQDTALPLGRVEPAPRAPDLQVGLLGDLLGLRRVAYDAEGEAVDPGRGRVVQLGEGRLVTAARAVSRSARSRAARTRPPGGCVGGRA